MKKLLRFFFSRDFMMFFAVSGTGLCIDLGIFSILQKLGVEVFFTNFISSFCAVTFVYFFSTKHVFSGAGFSLRKTFLFFSYYLISISFFSAVIKTLVLWLSIEPLLAKLLVIFPSLLTNYFFASRIIRKKANASSEAMAAISLSQER